MELFNTNDDDQFNNESRVFLTDQLLAQLSFLIRSSIKPLDEFLDKLKKMKFTDFLSNEKLQLLHRYESVVVFSKASEISLDTEVIKAAIDGLCFSYAFIYNISVLELALEKYSSHENQIMKSLSEILFTSYRKASLLHAASRVSNPKI